MTGSLGSASSSNPPPNGDFEKLRACHAAADEMCRAVQAFVSEAGVPAINELRYVAFHMVEALTLDANGEVKITSADDLKKAIHHCQRATYEAGEAGILTALDQIDEFRDAFKNIVIGETISEWPTICLKAEDAKNHIKAKREHGDDRTGDHDGHKQIFDELVGYCKILRVGRDECNKAISRQATDARRFIITIVVAVVFGIFALPSAISEIRKWVGEKETTGVISPVPKTEIGGAPATAPPAQPPSSGGALDTPPPASP